MPTGDIYIYDVLRNDRTQLTFSPAHDDFPLWTPDGERMVFTSGRGGQGNLYLKAADGTGEVERLTESTYVQSPHSWSGDGEMLVFVSGVGDLRTLSFDGEPSSSPLLEAASSENRPSVSPDGRWMAYDSDQEYFCDGLAEELIDALARLEGLRVVARTSAFRFRGNAPDLREVGEKLNVKTVLEGSVRKAGNRLRINAQLINTEDGYHVWSERYDRTLDDVFAVQDEIARAVVNRLAVQLAGDTGRLFVPSETADPEAHELFLKGRELASRFAVPALERSIDFFERAIAQDADFAPAYAAQANACCWLGILEGRPPREVFAMARRAAEKALSLDSELPEAHAALASVLYYFDWDWAGAERAFRRALDRSPAL